MMFRKILIANRGEIACRIIETCHQLGIKTVAVFSDIDRNALFVEKADEAFSFDSNELNSSYLNGQKIIDIAKKSHCQAIHPGYGFLSENADFSKQCVDNNLTFIGPNADCITKMGCKKEAKALMEKNGIPVVPGFNVDSDNDALLIKQANIIGYPLIIKAASGGGGKGMKLVKDSSELISAIASAKREALKSFANDALLIEKYLTAPRHIEVQIMADNHGNCVHVFDRDCSIQRRHQKIIEEAPAIDIPDNVRAAMHQTGINAAKAIDYAGAGTIEFLLDGNDFYFMEMNTRLQVEHPVSECVSSIDLVHWQLLVAANFPLPLAQADIHLTGHAIETRIYAEDPSKEFLPQTGKLTRCHWPDSTTASLRIDTGVTQGDVISVHYDPMIAKIITFAPSRQAAIYAMIDALQKTTITGLKTNISFLKNILKQDAFNAGDLSTHYLENNPINNLTPIELSALCAATFRQLSTPNTAASPWQINDAWQANLERSHQHHFCYESQALNITLLKQGPHHFKSDVKGYEAYQAYVKDAHTLTLSVNQQRQTFSVFECSDGVDVISSNTHHRLTLHKPNYSNHAQSEGSLNAPMPGMVVSVNCAVKDVVKKNQVLMIIEAMKMEHQIKAPFAGTIDALFYKTGYQVAEGQMLLSLKALKDKS